MVALDWVSLGAVPAGPGRQMPAKAKGARASSRANQWQTFGRLSVYSLNAVAGTRQRLSSQGRQWRLSRLRTLVTGPPPNWIGPGMPQRIISNSRSPSGALRTTGASSLEGQGN
jgi:hypothetical protein